MPEGLIRVSAFLRKEVIEVLRQPQLLATLVLGPFLILFLFGVGYRAVPPPIRTVFVIADEEPGPVVEELRDEMRTVGEGSFEHVGTVRSEEQARRMLGRGRADLAVVLPQDPGATIRNGRHAEFRVYHAEVDPFQVDFVRFVAERFVEDINRELLRSVVADAQSHGSIAESSLGDAQEEASAFQASLREGDEVSAERHRRGLEANLQTLSLALGPSAVMLSGVEEDFPGQGAAPASARVLRELVSSAEDLEHGDRASRMAKAAEMETALGQLASRMESLSRLEPEVVVSPFRATVEGTVGRPLSVTDFYTPAVIALLLQHLAVTAAGLSLVRERNLGTTELFRVSPLRPGETITGKYVSHLLFGSAIAFLLTVIARLGLGTPVLGGWGAYALTLLVLIFTSLGIGFLISLAARTDNQAVQYTMILLLASIFFSGLFLSLEMLWEPVRAVTWALPVTYAIHILRDVMLLGRPLDPVILTAMAAMGVLLFLAGWLLLRRRMVVA